MKYQVHGLFGGDRVLIGWPRKSLKAALCFMRNAAKKSIYSDLCVVGPKGREWFDKREGQKDE